jgi:hypothetical protein
MNQDEEELSYLDDFQEILQSEVYVDLERLRILARHGIPDQIRGVCAIRCYLYTSCQLNSFVNLLGSLEVLVGRPTS